MLEPFHLIPARAISERSELARAGGGGGEFQNVLNPFPAEERFQENPRSPRGRNSRTTLLVRGAGLEGKYEVFPLAQKNESRSKTSLP